MIAKNIVYDCRDQHCSNSLFKDVATGSVSGLEPLLRVVDPDQILNSSQKRTVSAIGLRGIYLPTAVSSGSGAVGSNNPCNGTGMILKEMQVRAVVPAGLDDETGAEKFLLTWDENVKTEEKSSKPKTPGGIQVFGKTTDQVIYKETLEETNSRIKFLEPLTVTDDSRQKTVYDSETGKPLPDPVTIHSVLHFYVVGLHDLPEPHIDTKNAYSADENGDKTFKIVHLTQDQVDEQCYRATCDAVLDYNFMDLENRIKRVGSLPARFVKYVANKTGLNLPDKCEYYFTPVGKDKANSKQEVHLLIKTGYFWHKQRLLWNKGDKGLGTFDGFVKSYMRSKKFRNDKKKWFKFSEPGELLARYIL